MSVNRVRGEVDIEFGGRQRVLCLTLGALAKIEAALSVKSLAEIATALATPSAEDLLEVLAALLEGGGEEVAMGDLRAARLDLATVSKAIGEAFRLACGGSE